MKALDRKLFRDLWHMRGQVLAIAAVIMGGVATMVIVASTYDSLVNHARPTSSANTVSPRCSPASSARPSRWPSARCLARGGTPGDAGEGRGKAGGGRLFRPHHRPAAVAGRTSAKRSSTGCISSAAHGAAVEHRRGGAVRHLRRRPRLSARRPPRRHHQRQAQAAHRGRRRGVAGIHLPDRARRHVPGLQALRRAVDGAQRAGRSLRHGRRLQPG